MNWVLSPACNFVMSLGSQSASDKGCDLVVLPEMWNCPYSNDSFPTYAEVAPASQDAVFSLKDSPSIHAMSQMAQKSGVTLVGGSVPERDNDKLYNTCLVFNKDGQIVAKHRWVQLCLLLDDYVLVCFKSS